MAHIYITFNFGTDEEKAQQARHKLDGWRQAFRLDKKLLYKFERPAREGDGAAAAEPASTKKETAKADKSGKSKTGKGAGMKAKAAKETEEATEVVAPSGPVKLHLRLAFSGHEK